MIKLESGNHFDRYIDDNSDGSRKQPNPKECDPPSKIFLNDKFITFFSFFISIDVVFDDFIIQTLKDKF